MKDFLEQRFPLPMNLQLFAGDGGNDAGEDGADDGGDDGGQDLKGDGDKQKTFTQEELERHVKSRLDRAKKAGQQALAKELGFESVEAMKAALKPKNEGGKGDNKKVDPADIEKLLDERLKEQAEKTFQRLLTAEVKIVANELGFADWEDALKLADLSGAKENDKGEIEGVKEALEKLAQAKPHLLKTKPTSGRFGADIRGGSSQQDERKKRIEHFAKLAQSRGSAPDGVYDPWKPKKD